jgi:hypothetical protein
MAITAIPTTYKGIEFRSRLEAKWAIMFDYFDWRWEYEPIDLAGYIPDFHVDFGREQFFIEIKPEMTSWDLLPALEKACEARGDRTETILVLGGSRGTPRHGYEYGRWDLNALMRQNCWPLVDDVYLAICPTCHTIVPLTYDGGWGFPCCPIPEGDNKHQRHELPIIEGLIEDYWTQATNRVKYRHRAR